MVADDYAALMLTGAIAAVLVILAAAMAWRSITRDVDSAAMEKIWATLLAVVSALIGFLFGQSLG